MNDEFPEALQIEITNKCNFNCQMCIRRVWNAKPIEINMTLYRKIARTCFSRIKRLILYGFGEPFIHPKILEMLRIARKTLPDYGEIIISTNGSLINSETARKVVKEIDSISFSVDAVSRTKLSYIREGSDLNLTTKNIERLVKTKNEAGRDFKLGLEAVILTDNFLDIPRIVKFAIDYDFDFMMLSHVVPYTKEIFAKSVYVTLSEPTIEILKPSLKYRWDLVHKSTLELFGKTYGVEMDAISTQLVRSFWTEGKKKDYWINLPLFLSSTEKLDALSLLKEVFHKSQKIAHQYQLDLKLLNLYPDAKVRKCPYTEKKTTVIRVDGSLSPCQEFMYTHPLYVNTHKKDIHEIIFGKITQRSIEEIWSMEAYVNFREIRRDIAKNIPWCGDCPYSTLGCFFTKSNDVDCYANKPTCNECLYSVNLAQCNI
ncbi:MAG: SPASM domain-containing protein [Candidatus Bathyarchaeia archaeon]